MNKYLILALCLGSCYTPNKANKELNKANDKYPQLVAKFTREKFPCITKSADTLTTTDTLYQYVDVQCPDTTSQTDTIYLDKVKTKTIKKLVAIPQQTRIINHYIEDSAKIKMMAYENEQCDTKLKKEADKAETRLKWSMRLLIALIISMILNVVLFKKSEL